MLSFFGLAVSVEPAFLLTWVSRFSCPLRNLGFANSHSCTALPCASTIGCPGRVGAGLSRTWTLQKEKSIMAARVVAHDPGAFAARQYSPSPPFSTPFISRAQTQVFTPSNQDPGRHTRTRQNTTLATPGRRCTCIQTRISDERATQHTTLWKSYILSCRTKLEKLLCLKYFGNTCSEGETGGAGKQKRKGKEVSSGRESTKAAPG